MGTNEQVGSKGRAKWAVIVVGAAVALVMVILAVGALSSSDPTDTSDERSRSEGSNSTRSESDTTQSTVPVTTGDRSARGSKGDPIVVDKVIQAGIIQREYLVVTPSWADGIEPLPLVVAIHGLTVDRHAMLNVADWRGAVEERGFVAVFPQGLANSWNVGPCCPPSNLVQTDDVAFVDSVIAAVKSDESIDADRVFMTGFSAGALMTYRYGCERSKDLRAIGPIAGVNLTQCAPARARSLIHQHSDPDLVVPFDGGLGVGQIITSEPLPPVVNGVEKWAAASGCSRSTDWQSVSSGVDQKKWGGCAGGARVELVKLSGLGHEWPRTADYDGLATMLDFFGI